MISVSPVQSSLVFGAVRRVSPLLSYPTLFHRSPNCRYEKEVSLFPQPRQSNLPAPTSPKLPPLSACLSCSLLLGLQFAPVSPARQPACLIFFVLRPKGPQPVSRLASTVRHHSRSIRPHQRVELPQPCHAVRACARMHAGARLPLRAPSKTLRDPLPWRSSDRECRSASNLPVSCISCISCTS